MGERTKEYDTPFSTPFTRMAPVKKETLTAIFTRSEEHMR